MFQIEGANIEKQGSDIAPGQRTHVYQKNEVVGTAHQSLGVVIRH